MHGENFFIHAFIYLTAAVIAAPAAKKAGLSPILGYLIAGAIMGPFALNLVGQEGKDLMHFAEFGVVLMLFLIGLELEPKKLWRLRSAILGLGGLQVGITWLIIFLIAFIAGLEWRQGLSVGMILALSSTAIVMQSLEEKGLLKTEGGQNAFSVLLFQDIAVIPMLALLPLLAVHTSSLSPSEHTGSQTAIWIVEQPGWAQTLIVTCAVATIILAGRFLVQPLLRAIAQTRMREIFTAASLLLVIAIALLMAKVGLSPALGTFLAGVILANSEYRHELVGDIEPFKGLLLGLFFITVGASMDFHYIGTHLFRVLGLVMALIVLKAAVIFFLGRLFKMSHDQNTLFSLALSQGGEFAFVLFSFASQYRVLSESLAKPLIAVVALSMVATPILLLANEKIIQPRIGTKEKEERPADAIDEENPVILAGFGQFGNIIGRLLRAHGVGVTILEYDSNSVDLLRKLGFRVFYGDATRLDLLTAAGAERARLLIITIDDPGQVLTLVQTAQKHFPHLKIMARAAGQSDAYDLIEAGIKHVFRETFETSLCAGREALKLLGFRAHQVHRAALSFRRHDQSHLNELARARHEHHTFLNIARQKIEDLEELLQEEERSGDDSRDRGWDIDSRREEAKKSSGKK